MATSLYDIKLVSAFAGEFSIPDYSIYIPNGFFPRYETVLDFWPLIIAPDKAPFILNIIKLFNFGSGSITW